LDKLKQAQKKLEELLQQLREEELKQMLAKLQARCEKMLNMQMVVKTSTEELDKAIAALPLKKTWKGRRSALIGVGGCRGWYCAGG